MMNNIDNCLQAQIIAESGPIIIGENNLVEESARIINRNSDTGKSESRTVPVMIVGNNNVFEVDCTSLALKIGDNNVLESKVASNTIFTFVKCSSTLGSRYPAKWFP